MVATFKIYFYFHKNRWALQPFVRRKEIQQESSDFVIYGRGLCKDHAEVELWGKTLIVTQEKIFIENVAHFYAL